LEETVVGSADEPAEIKEREEGEVNLITSAGMRR
jgi:hypothetical protein